MDFLPCLSSSETDSREAGAPAAPGLTDTASRFAPTSSDANLLRTCLAANYAQLLRRLRQRLGCADLAEDCLHDAWLRLGEMTLPSSVHNPLAYVYRVACNLAIDRMRQKRGDVSLDELPEQMLLADTQPGPAAVAEARSKLAALDNIIRTLPSRHQAVLFDLRVEGRSRTEVASRFGLSLRQVDTVLRHTLDSCLAARP